MSTERFDPAVPVHVPQPGQGRRRSAARVRVAAVQSPPQGRPQVGVLPLPRRPPPVRVDLSQGVRLLGEGDVGPRVRPRT